ncbi:MAG: hypothetical protein Q9175_007391, partial [Cornicularia normoerica]
MFARACPRALRTRAIRSILHERPKCQSAFHSLSSLPIRRPLTKRKLRSPSLLARRNASTIEATKKLFEENPFSMTLAFALIIFGISMLIYINYIYQVYIIGDFKAYPEPVAAKLRRALYYTNMDVQPKNALKYYRQAIMLADEMGLDPFSDEMLGAKIQVAFFFEKLHQYRKAIDVLELIREDCLKWMEKLGGKKGNEGKRTRVLGKTIAISVKLGEHYANQYIDDMEAAEE